MLIRLFLLFPVTLSQASLAVQIPLPSVVIVDPKPPSISVVPQPSPPSLITQVVPEPSPPSQVVLPQSPTRQPNRPTITTVGPTSISPVNLPMTEDSSSTNNLLVYVGIGIGFLFVISLVLACALKYYKRICNDAAAVLSFPYDGPSPATSVQTSYAQRLNFYPSQSPNVVRQSPMPVLETQEGITNSQSVSYRNSPKVPSFYPIHTPNVVFQSPIAERPSASSRLPQQNMKPVSYRISPFEPTRTPTVNSQEHFYSSNSGIQNNYPTQTYEQQRTTKPSQLGQEEMEMSHSPASRDPNGAPDRYYQGMSLDQKTFTQGSEAILYSDSNNEDNYGQIQKDGYYSDEQQCYEDDNGGYVAYAENIGNIEPQFVGYSVKVADKN